MKITAIQNNYNTSFKGLDYKKVLPPDAKKYIIPNLQELKTLASNVDITLSSSSHIIKSKHFSSPRPALDISISPKDISKYNIPVSKHTIILNSTTEPEDIFDLIKTVVRNIFF